MAVALQIGLLLVLIALIGIILGYLFGKLSCKKQSNDAYFNKNDYCESEYVASNQKDVDFNSEKPSILSSENVSTASENTEVDTQTNVEAQSAVSNVISNDSSATSATDTLEENTISAKELSATDGSEGNDSLDSNVNVEKQSFVDSSSNTAEDSSETQEDSTDTNKSEDSNLETDKEAEDAKPSTEPSSESSDTQSEEDDNKDKPKVLDAPRDGKADNLCRIKGIGFVIEEKLHKLGVYHFDQIAAWNEKEIEWIDSHLAFSGRIKREDWIAQAEKLASGEETEFSKRVDKGSVATSRKTTDKEK